jgi:hypothetical protein
VAKKQEAFTTNSNFGWSPLKSADGFLISESCRVGVCLSTNTFFTVNLQTGVVDAAMLDGERATYFLSGARPPAPLKSAVEETVAAVKEALRK